MKYEIELSPRAFNDIAFHKKSGDKGILKKIDSLIDELREHPRTGTGKPELLKNNLSGYWSRRITQKHRLVYRIEDELVTVEIVQAQGHYEDK